MAIVDSMIATVEGVEIVAPSEDAVQQLRDDFERSALHWLDRASEHELAGRKEAAASALTIASIAAHVACGRAL